MYRKADNGWMKHLDFTLIDGAFLQLSYVAAFFVRYGTRCPYPRFLYCNMMFVFLLIQISVTFFGESFKNVLKRGCLKEFVSVMKHVSLVILIAAFYLFAVRQGEDYSRIALVLTGIFYAAFSYSARIVWKRHLLARGGGEKGKRSLLIITSSAMVEEIVDNILKNNYECFCLVGIMLLDRDLVGRKVKGVRIVANVDTVVEYVCREWVDEVFISLPRQLSPPRSLIDCFFDMGVTVHLNLAKKKQLKGQRQRVERLGNYVVLTSSINMASWKQAFLKRTMDITGGLVGCMMTGLLFMVIAPCIFIKSPGPVFFSQIRIGRNGKKFKLYKFRSMYLDAEERKKELMSKNRITDSRMFKMEEDPRVIGGARGVGNFIRNYSIDEFPQFWNVLKGEMSMVGTRPPTQDEWARYDVHHRARLSVKPGITGLWQVSGRSDITDFEEVVRLDRDYITDWSIALDMKILIRTMFVVFEKRGAM